MRVKFSNACVATGVAVAMTLLLAGVLSGPTTAALAAPSPEGARQAVVSVKGMACSICARHLDSRLRKMAAVDKVKVDLEKQTATLSLKPNGDLTDDDIKEAVRDAGFNVTRIERRGQAEATSSNTVAAEFKVDGMDCSRCAANLARVLEEQSGVATARVDFDKKLAVVQYDANKTTAEQIEKTIEETGVFRAELVSPPLTKDKK